MRPTTEDIGIYVACNNAANLVKSGSRAAAAVARATTASSVLYGVGIKSTLALGFGPCPAIALSTVFSSAALAAPVAAPAAAGSIGLALARPVSKVLAFKTAAAAAVPTGVLFAAEYALYAATKERLVSSGAWPKALSESPEGRFAIGAASITAVCAAYGAARALPAVAVIAGRPGAAFVPHLRTETQWRAVWYGAFEALKTLAHGNRWDAVDTSAAKAESTTTKEAVQSVAAPVHMRSNRRMGTKVNYRRVVKRVDVGSATRRGRKVLHTPVKVLTTLVC